MLFFSIFQTFMVIPVHNPCSWFPIQFRSSLSVFPDEEAETRDGVVFNLDT